MYNYRSMIINVVDGDTVDAVIDLGFKTTIEQRLRIARIDTPERAHQGFKEAKEFVENLIGGKEVTIKTEKVSKFGYYLAEIYTINGLNVSDELLKAGLAKSYNGGKKA